MQSGFAQLPRRVLFDPNLSHGAKVTFAVLSHYAWNRSSCFPGQGTIADHLGTTARSVRSYLKELQKAGYVERVRRGRMQTNLYLLHV